MFVFSPVFNGILYIFIKKRTESNLFDVIRGEPKGITHYNTINIFLFFVGSTV